MAETEKMVVVVYDISDDKRRTRLHKRLQDFGTPVQFSVFECLVTNSRYKEMQQVVRKTIKPRIDHVRYYPICNACREKIEVTGRKEVTTNPESIVI